MPEEHNGLILTTLNILYSHKMKKFKSVLLLCPPVNLSKHNI